MFTISDEIESRLVLQHLNRRNFRINDKLNLSLMHAFGSCKYNCPSYNVYKYNSENIVILFTAIKSGKFHKKDNLVIRVGEFIEFM